MVENGQKKLQFQISCPHFVGIIQTQASTLSTQQNRRS